MAQTKQDMGTGNVKKLMLQLMIPAVVAQVVNLLYNIVDRIYIGHIAGIGAAALTGVGLFTPILMLLNAFAMLVGAGGAPRTAIALGQGEKEQAEKIILQQLHRAVVLCSRAHHRLLRGSPGAAAAVRCQRRHPALCAFLQPHLHSGLGVRAGGAGHEPLHHDPGLRPDQHAHHGHWCGHQHHSGPHPDLWVRAGRAGRGHCHGAQPGRGRGVDPEIPHRQKDHPAPAQGLSQAGTADHPAGDGAGHLVLRDALHREPAVHQLQLQSGAVRRRCGRGCHDGHHQRIPAVHPAHSGRLPGRPAGDELQLRRGQKGARERGLPLSADVVRGLHLPVLAGDDAGAGGRGRHLHLRRRAHPIHHLGHAHLHGRHFRHGLPDRLPAELYGAGAGKGQPAAGLPAQDHPADPAHLHPAAPSAGRRCSACFWPSRSATFWPPPSPPSPSLPGSIKILEKGAARV